MSRSPVGFSTFVTINKNLKSSSFPDSSRLKLFMFLWPLWGRLLPGSAGPGAEWLPRGPSAPFRGFRSRVRSVPQREPLVVPSLGTQPWVKVPGDVSSGLEGGKVCSWVGSGAELEDPQLPGWDWCVTGMRLPQRRVEVGRLPGGQGQMLPAAGEGPGAGEEGSPDGPRHCGASHPSLRSTASSGALPERPRTRQGTAVRLCRGHPHLDSELGSLYRV